MDRNELKQRAVSVLRKYRYALLVVLLGIGLMLIPGRQEQTQTASQSQQTQPQADIEQRLADILSQIKGAGRVRVMVTVAQGESILYQQDENVGADGSGKWDTVIITDENRAQQGLVSQILPPKYQGVIVVCQGAERASVRLSIIEAVARVTGLRTDRISVLLMK